MNDEFNQQQKITDAILIRETNLDSHTWLTVSNIVMSLRYLQYFCDKQNLSIADVTPKLIIGAFQNNTPT